MEFAESATTPIDVCIIGSGAAGATLALDLAQRGKRVVVLEAGEHYPRDKAQDYLTQFYNLGINAFEPKVKDLDQNTSAGEEWYGGVRVRAVGGSTLRWKGNTPRLHPGDFRLATESGLGQDWPITYEDLEPWYVKAENSLGVACIDDNPFEGPRSADYPLPEFPYSTIDEFFMPAFKKAGVRWHHMPQARNSIKYQGRSECLNSATCGPYCPNGAKAAMDQYQLPTAFETGNCQIIKDAAVLRFEWDREDRIRRAVFRFSDDTAEQAIEAPVFVLATGGMEAARLLLLSTGSGHPDGLGNNTDQVGRCFMDHPAFNAIGKIKEQVYPFRGPYQTMVSHFHYPRDKRMDGGCFSIQVQNWGGFPPSVIVELTKKWGPDLKDQIREMFGKQVAIEIMVEQLPSTERRVSLDPEKKDGLGQPLPQVTWDVGEYGLLGRDTAYAKCKEILEAADAYEILPADEVLWGNHHSGTTRMGIDPKESVVNRDLRIHGVENVYVCSSACFPTIGAAHPTLTIAALAHRLADHLAS